jgi:hypothetical protein
MDRVRPKRNPFFDGQHLHGGVTPDEIGEKRRTLSRDVHDHHEREITIRGHGGEDMLQGLMASRGGADADDKTWRMHCAKQLTLRKGGSVIFRRRRDFRQSTPGRIRAFCCIQLIGFSHREISIFTAEEKEKNNEK